MYRQGSQKEIVAASQCLLGYESALKQSEAHHSTECNVIPSRKVFKTAVNLCWSGYSRNFIPRSDGSLHQDPKKEIDLNL